MSYFPTPALNQALTPALEKIKSALKRDNKKVLAQIFRYGFVSIIALAADLGILLLLKEVFQFNYLLAATVSFSFGIIINYICSRLWVFQKSHHNSQTTEFGIFIIVGVTGLLLNNLIIYFLTEQVFIFYFYSKLVATVFVFFWNFFLRKYLIYS